MPIVYAEEVVDAVIQGREWRCTSIVLLYLRRLLMYDSEGKSLTQTRHPQQSPNRKRRCRCAPFRNAADLTEQDDNADQEGRRQVRRSNGWLALPPAWMRSRPSL